MPLARQWIAVDDGRAALAATVLGRFATDEDLDAVRDAFARAWSGEAVYTMCSLVEALGRIRRGAPHPELDLVFTETTYSYARRRGADAMAATDARFAPGYAVECLWDCEGDTRLIGAAHVDVGADGARAGLDRLANDPFEDADIREAVLLRQG